MDAISIKDTKGFVREFLDEYLSDGLGSKNRREIDILIMNLLMKYGDLAVKSNQELSILLQATESKIKGLRYEARLKYPPDEDYVKREFLYILYKSQSDFTSGKIMFAIEDVYLRHAIQGRLKARGMFADTSFNTEIVRIDKNSLESVIEELYGKETSDVFHDGFSEMENQEEGIDAGASIKKALMKFVIDTGISLGLNLLKSRLST